MLLQKTKDRHLNLFSLYRGNSLIENNLTRALAILLQNDALFFREFVNDIIDDKTIFNHLEDGDKAVIDIQVDTELLNDEAFNKIYGLTLTTKNIPPEDFEKINLTERKGKKITDLVIRIKDVLIVIEVKRTEENCVVQLKEQLLDVKDKVEKYTSYTWEKTLEVIRRTENIYSLIDQDSAILQDFSTLIANEYAEWLPTKPFKFFKVKEHDSVMLHQLYKRLNTAKKNIKDYEIDTKSGRTFIKVNWRWADEVNFWFSESMDENFYLGIYLHPANTKGQGKHIFKGRSQDWQNKKSIEAEGFGSFEMNIIPIVKVSNAYGSFLTQIKIEKELTSKIHTEENYWRTGKWTRERFGELENWFDDYFDKEVLDWRAVTDWENKVLNTGWNNILISLGFEVEVKIPYSKLQEIDTSKSSIKKVGELLSKVTDQLAGLLD